MIISIHNVWLISPRPPSAELISLPKMLPDAVGLPLKMDADIGRILALQNTINFNSFSSATDWNISADLEDLSCFDGPSSANTYHLKPNHAIVPCPQPDSSA